MITYLLDTLVNSIKTSLINKLGLDPSTEVDLDEFPQLIDDIPILDSVEELTVTENGTYTGTEGVTYNPVNVNLPLGSKSVTANGTYTASDDSLQGYSSVTVDIDDTDLYRDTTDSTYESVKTLSNCGAFPMLSLKAEINAQQDLHGYDAPWVGGAGKNKINLADITAPSVGFVYNREPINVVANTYTLSFNFTGGSGSISIALRNGETVVSALQNQPLVNGLNTITLPTLSNNADSISLYAGIGGTYENFMLEVGSTATSFAPYSNICPISGWDEVNVTVSPLNITPLYNGQIYGDGTWVENSARLTNVQTAQSNTYFLKAGTYTLDFDKLNSNASNLVECAVLTKDSNFNIIDNFANAWQPIPFTFTLTQDGYLYFTARKDYTTVLNPSDYRGKILGTTYTIDLDGTRYGGKLDVVSGELVVDRGIVDLGNLTYTYDAVYNRFASSAISNLKRVDVRTLHMQSSCYKCVWHNESIENVPDASFYNSNNETNIYIHDSRYSDATALKTALAGQTVCYPLATPQTYQLTPTQVKSLLGTNNIWADTGDVGDVRYFKKVEL